MARNDVKSSMFDRVAEVAAGHVSRAWFFCMCLLIVVLWLPSYFVIGKVDTWQLIINTLTTIITFLMVALLQNSQQQFEELCIEQNRAIMAELRALRQEVPSNGRAHQTSS